MATKPLAMSSFTIQGHFTLPKKMSRKRVTQDGTEIVEVCPIFVSRVANLKVGANETESYLTSMNYGEDPDNLKLPHHFVVKSLTMEVVLHNKEAAKTSQSVDQSPSGPVPLVLENGQAYVKALLSSPEWTNGDRVIEIHLGVRDYSSCVGPTPLIQTAKGVKDVKNGFKFWWSSWSFLYKDANGKTTYDDFRPATCTGGNTTCEGIFI